MSRLLHLCLMLSALLGLVGQSTAMAMAPTRATPTSMAGTDCMDMANAPAQDEELPCRKVTLQCMAAMGCSPVALVAPTTLSSNAVEVGRDVLALSLAARLTGRSYGPEPDPPTLLI